MKDRVGYEVMEAARVYTERQGYEVVELNVQPDHVHFLVKVPPKVSISRLMGEVKSKTAIPLLEKEAILGESLLSQRLLR